MTYNDYEAWEKDAKWLGYDIEPGGTSILIAHKDGEERGWWDPNYNAGFGELTDK